MGIFVRAVITGFGFSAGQALFKRVQKQLGLEEETRQTDASVASAATDGNADGQVDAPAT
jgi:hypothetical protein